MIIRLNGGLGNQMFQYAYGRAYSIENKCKLKYYFICYPNGTIRNFELNIFNIKGKRINSLLPDILVKISNFLQLKKPLVHYGYWQNEKFFIKHEDKIREDYRFIRPLDSKNKTVLAEIKNNNSISIHIRRGDYAVGEKIKEIHGLLPIEYYKKAIRLIQKQVENPRYYIFSDDSTWVKQKLKIIGAQYINWNTGVDSYKDMQLMSNCKHNIIANSSFSWWAAWLNTNKNKIIIAPKNWFIDKKANEETKNIVPEQWIKI